MYVLDLFSGIGGFSLGLERAGMKTVAFCEIDPYCRRVLAKHWPGVKIHEDVKQLDGSQYVGTVDVICGGYPCQPFSAAGKQKGEADPRHLWPEMRRIIRETRPRWVIAENVRGHVNLGFDTVAAQLEDDGFTAWPFIIPACAVDAPHKRERLWIVGHAASEGFPHGGGAPLAHPREEESEPERSGGVHGGLSLVADPEGQRFSHGNDGELQRPPAGEIYPFAGPGGAGRGMEAGGWEAEPAVGRVAHGIPNRVDRLRALGNAVVPQIPELIGRAIIAYEQQLATAA